MKNVIELNTTEIETVVGGVSLSVSMFDQSNQATVMTAHVPNKTTSASHGSSSHLIGKARE